MQQSLNALIERSEKRGEEVQEVTGAEVRKKNKGRGKAEKDEVFEAGRKEIEKSVSKEENKHQIKIQSKRTDTVGHRLKRQKQS